MSSSESTQYNLQPPILQRQLTSNKWTDAIYLMTRVLDKNTKKLVVEVKYDNPANPTGYNIIHSIKSDKDRLYMSTDTVSCIS